MSFLRNVVGLTNVSSTKRVYRQDSSFSSSNLTVYLTQRGIRCTLYLYTFAGACKVRQQSCMICYVSIITIYMTGIGQHRTNSSLSLNK